MGGVERLRHGQSGPFFNFNLLVLQRIAEPGRKPENIQAGKTKYQLVDGMGFEKQLEWQPAAPAGENGIGRRRTQRKFRHAHPFHDALEMGERMGALGSARDVRPSMDSSSCSGAALVCDI